MTQAYFYNTNIFRQLPLDDVQLWASYFGRQNGWNRNFVDRINVIKLPIRAVCPPELKIPEYDSNFNMTYEECCQEQVRKIIEIQDRLDVPIHLYYSGGIDSSLVLVSFIKELGQAESEKRIQIVLGNESIDENPYMWGKIIRKSNFKLISGQRFENRWSRDRILVGGEFQDQLLGSGRDIKSGKFKLDAPITDLLLTEYHIDKGLTRQQAEVWAGVFSKQLQAAPCPVETFGDWSWWVNFSCFWTGMYFRWPVRAHNPEDINQQYLNDYYHQFYNSENFQKWSMSNRTHKHQGTQISYKWHAKDLIADFLQAPEYKMKLKRLSLYRIFSSRKLADVIDENYQFIMDMNPEEWYNPDNSFK